MKNMQVNILDRNTKEKQKVLRSSGFVPAVVYSHGKTEHYKIPEKEVIYIFSHGITESTILELKKAKKENISAYIKEYQKHPVSSQILHIDFFKVTRGEKIKTHIPIHFVGDSAGVKAGGVFENFIRELEIETYPRFLKEYLEVDISSLDIGDSIHVADITLPEETKVLINGNPQVCHVAHPIKVETIEEEPTEKEEEIEDKEKEK